MRLDKKFLARLLDIPEDIIGDIKGKTFELTTTPDDAPETFEGWLNKRFKTKLEGLQLELQRQDDLGAIVRAHIHIEHELNDFIYFAAPSPAHVKSMELDFSKTVRLALVLGLNPNLQSPLNAAGKLRNDFAHRLDMKLGEERMKTLAKTLAPEAKQQFDALFKSSLTAAPSESKLPPEGKLYFRTRLQLIAFFFQLFRDVARERHRLAFEKLQTIAWH